MQKEYITTDLREATFLAYKGIPYKIHREGSKSSFLFPDTEGIASSLIKEFWNGSNEARLLNQHKEIKRLAVFQGYRKNYYQQSNQQKNESCRK